MSLPHACRLSASPAPCEPPACATPASRWVLRRVSRDRAAVFPNTRVKPLVLQVCLSARARYVSSLREDGETRPAAHQGVVTYPRSLAVCAAAAWRPTRLFAHGSREQRAMSGAAAFCFTSSVGAAELAGSSSAVYAVTVRTNLSEYQEHGEGPPASEAQQTPSEGLGGELDDDAAVDDLVTVPERTIHVKRSYSAFREVLAAVFALAAVPDAVRPLLGVEVARGS